MKHSTATHYFILGGLAIAALLVVFLISFKITNDVPAPVAETPAVVEPSEPAQAVEPKEVEPPAGLFSQEDLVLLNTTDWTTQTFTNLGFSLDAPSIFTWESQDIRRGTFDDQEFGDHGTLSLVHGEEGPGSSAAIAATATTIPINARGGYWADIANAVEGDFTCGDFAAPTDYVDELWSCSMFKNQHGTTVVHITKTWGSFVTHPAIINLYLLPHPNPDVRAVVLSDQRLLPQDYPRYTDTTDYLVAEGYEEIQDARNLLRTIVETVKLVEIDSF